MSLTIYKNSFAYGTEWIFLAPLTKWCILSQDTSEKKKSNHVETALIEKHKLDHSKDFSHPITSGMLRKAGMGNEEWVLWKVSTQILIF